MPELTDPFTGNVPRKMSARELARAIRLDIIAELDAVSLYAAHMDSTDDERVKAVIKHVMDEEKEHIGDFMALLHYLDPEQASLMEEGMEESRAILQAGASRSEESGEEEKESPQPTGLTVGNLVSGPTD